MWSGNSIQLFLHSDQHKGIIGFVSDNMGESWSVDEGKDGPIIYARGEGGYPTLLNPGNFGQIDSNNYLFYIANNSLMCKRLDLTGDPEDIQEILDEIIPTVVASDVLVHKAIATTDSTGNMLVYYLSSVGSVSVSISSDGGAHWETMNNW